METKEVKLAIVGFGRIGREVLRNTPFLQEQTAKYLQEHLDHTIRQNSTYFRVVGIADSGTYLYGDIDLPMPPAPDLFESAITQSKDFRSRIEQYKDKYGFVKCLAVYLAKHAKDAGIKGGSAKGMGGSELLSRLRDERLVPDIVIDVTPTQHPDKEGPDKVLERIKVAVGMGSNIVLANKAPIAYNFDEVRKLSEKSGRAIRCEATVGGELPFLGKISKYRDNNLFLRGIINGTTNFILNELAAGRPYKLAFNTAKELGLTESDPGEDTLGIDAARKLIIISKLAGKPVSPKKIVVSGITKMNVGGKFIEIRPATLEELEAFKSTHPAGDKDYEEVDDLTNAYRKMRLKMGYVPKLIAELDLVAMKGRVSLEWVAGDDPLKDVEDAKNKILLYSDSGPLYTSPALRGAGPEATANAIMLDCMRISCHLDKPYAMTMF